jgi:hypothetical protein
MKKNYFITGFFFVALFLVAAFITGCSKDGDSEDNELGGDTNIPLNQVGNTFRGGILVNDEFVNAPPYSFEIVASHDGVATVELIYDLQAVPELAFINDLIPDELKDDQGRLNCRGDVKMTSEGILDYTNLDGAPFTAVKYDAKVGDKYVLKKSNGQKITRKVIQRSEEDDFEWGLMLIKVITVEQDSRIPGIKNIIYKFNHKFGLVYIEANAEDGSKFSAYVNPADY